jgi:hypothetical protein
MDSKDKFLASNPDLSLNFNMSEGLEIDLDPGWVEEGY